MVRVCLALLVAGTVLAGPAAAATVRTETIRVAPQGPNGDAAQPGAPAPGETPAGAAQPGASQSIDVQPGAGDPATAPSVLPPVTGPSTGPQIPTDQLPATPGEEAPAEEDGLVEDRVSPQNQLPVPDVKYGTAELPAPVARMRDQLIEAARSGDIEKMRMVLEGNEMMPTLSLTEIGDPIEFLRASSGDGNGQEILAILLDVLEAGWVKTDAGTPQEMYVWPYFARYPFDKLSPQQKVEMYRIITAGDFAEMDAYGAWLFYRVGIGPDGTLHYFVAGE
ncbi:hypothetical protein [Pannonibacter tanglangensis]|uniref:Uncharacterized protein n=1 Tax=Pannonibacter tanglangensis TaxID=2750084 RepID=A0ABW9ZL83_9HYPH|nr:hypothetical protein [Pannonibacter sp. XCT-34]NBN64356.1 hypothetical protein [Pannonibacter sp. XCT-34]